MKRFLFIISLVFVLLVGVFGFSNVDVKVTSIFDDENSHIVLNIEDVTYGASVAFDGELSEENGYSFVYWIVNGVVGYDLPKDYAFTVLQEMELIAIFAPQDRYVVVFMDANGKLLDAQYVMHNGSATDEHIAFPSKIGYVVSEEKWDKSLSFITNHTILTLQYVKDVTSSFVLTVVNGMGSGVYDFNEVATVVADETMGDLVFLYWEEDGKELSRNTTYQFTIAEDRNLTAVYGESALLDVPKIITSNNLELRDGYKTYLSQLSVPDHYTLIEFGLIASLTEENITLDTPSITRYQGFTYFAKTKEWVMSIHNDLHQYHRAYMVLRNIQGDLLTVYSDIVESQNTYHERFSGFVGSGTSYISETFMGDSGFEFSVTQTRKNLDSYGIDTFGFITRVPGIISATMEGGIRWLSLDVMQAFTGSGTRTIEIYINNVLYQTQAITTAGVIYTIEIEDINIKGTFDLKIMAKGTNDRQITINNLRWGDYGSYVSTYFIEATSQFDTNIVFSSNGPYQLGEEVNISASSIPGYRFVGWKNKLTGNIFQTAQSVNLIVTKDLSLEAIFEEVETFSIDLSSNIEDAALYVIGQGPYAKEMLYGVEAEELFGYHFEHWMDLDTGLIVSFDTTFNILMARNHRFHAVYVEAEMRNLYMYQNVDTEIILSNEGPFIINSYVTLEAPLLGNHIFKHFLDYQTNEILSTQDVFHLQISKTHYIIAVYEEEQDARLYLEESFETASKVAYAAAIVEIDDFEWYLDSALIGTLSGDQKIGTKSVRMQGGSVTTLFGTSKVTNFSFYYGKYGTDANANFQVLVSFDAENWHVIDSLTAGSAFVLYERTLDADFYQTYEKTLDDIVYFKINQTSGNRMNVDLISIYRYHTTTPALPLIESDASNISFPNNSDRIQITLDEAFLYAYSYGDLWTGEGCQAYDIYLGDVDCSIHGFVDTSRLGDYKITYYVLDVDGNYASKAVDKVVLRDASLLEMDYVGYYDGIEGLYGEALLFALRDILNLTISGRTYGDARDILADADVDPNDPTKVLTIYSRASVARVWDATSWHREHVWPNSRLGIPRVDNGDINIGSDLHNLRAIVPTVNSSRSNKVFSNITTTDTYYPGDKDRGDVARILFYMVVMYQELTLVEEILPNNPLTNYTPNGAYMSVLEYLLTWHFQDEVDYFEQNRNEVIFTAQNNRNPFIDYPHLVELIWYNHPGIPVS